MFNLGEKKNLLTVETNNTVPPCTPEIVDQLVMWPTPLERAQQQTAAQNAAAADHKLNQCDSHSSCSGSPLDSPAGSNAPPSIEQNHSKLVKATLKLSLEMKRKNSCGGDSSETDTTKMAKLEECDSSDGDDDVDTDSKSMKCGLTPEDEDRRKKRRERNKIAATKCREKKRARTALLGTEAHHLDDQNKSLKAQLIALERERQKLVEIWQLHSTCSSLPAFAAPPTIPARFLSELSPNSIGSGNGNSSTAADANDTRPSRHAQPIPSVNTIGKFGHAKATKSRSRAGQQQSRNQSLSLSLSSSSSSQAPSPHRSSSQSNALQPLDVAIPTNNAITIIAAATAPNVAVTLPAMQQPSPQQQQQQPQQQLQQPLPQHQQPPLIDIGSYLGQTAINNATSVDLSATTIDMLLPSTYCKASPNDYAMSPDSGFIKSPVDSIGSNYSAAATTTTPVTVVNGCNSSSNFMLQLHHMNNNSHTNNNNNNNNVNNVNNNIMQQQQHLKNDYIPSPTSSHNGISILESLQFDQFGQHQQHQQQHQQQQQQLHNQHQNQLLNGGQHNTQHHHHTSHHHNHQQHHISAGLIGPGDGSEFELKCELVDSVGHSPYTTEQSADRFLYDAGIDGGDSSPMFSDNSNLCASTVLDQSDLKMLVAAGHLQQQQQLQQHQQQQQQQQLQQHLSNNNNGHINTMIGGHNGNHNQQNNLQHQQQHHNNNQQQHMNSGGVGSGGIIEFATNNGHLHGNVFDSLKTDYQNADYMSLAEASAVIGDAHFIDMDSGITTYPNYLTNTGNGSNNGCMA